MGFEARPVLSTVTPLVWGLEAYAGWQSPDEYSASPPNSIALLLQWNVALSFVGTMGASLWDKCHKWQPSTSAPAQAMEVDTPTSEVQVAAGLSASAKVPASAEASVSVGVSAAVEAPVSARTVPSGTGTSVKGGWKVAAGKKKKKKGGSKRGAVSVADPKSELSAISLGESQGQVVDVEAMEVTVGGDSRLGPTSPGGKEKGAVPQPPPASASIGPAFDAHFHLDRMIAKGKGKLSVDSIYKMDVAPRDKIDLKGGCMVFCDPEHCPNAEDLQKIREHAGFRVAVGIHPKHAGQAGAAQVRRLKQLVAHPDVAAMGEIGLDFTAGSLASVPQQEQLFGECLTVAQRDKPIDLHIRPASVEPEVIRQAYLRVRGVMKGIIGSRQVVQLHSFSGGADVVQGWLSDFPNTYFSFSGLTARFSDYQKRGLKAVQVGKMLLETDSPYLVVRGADAQGDMLQNSPLYLGAVAKLVANIRGESRAVD